MSWSMAANVATTVGTIVALAGVIITAVISLRSEGLTRSGQLLEREQAESAAARSEAAAALTEEYTRRVVDSLETMAMRSAATTATSLPMRVRWSLVHDGGDTYRLENDGELAAKDVEISADPTLHVLNVPEKEDIGAHEAVTFMAVVTMGTRDRTITVTWTDSSAPTERSTWRYPLPSRPPR